MPIYATRSIPDSDAIVQRVDFLGSSTYTAYEPSVGEHFSTSHWSIMVYQGRVYGEIQCRRLSAELDALKPDSAERREALAAFRDANEAEAIRLIRWAFPETEEVVNFHDLTPTQWMHHQRAVALGGKIYV